MRKKENIGHLLGCLHRHGHMYLHQAFSSLGLGSSSHHFLLILAHRDGVSQTELTEILHYDKATTARAIRKLKENDYVKKLQDPDDHRAVRIYLTDKGKALIPRIKSILRNWSNILTTGLSTAEKDDALRLLGKMVDNAVDGVRGGELHKHH